TAHRNPKAISNWIMTDLLREIDDRGEMAVTTKVPPGHLAELITFVDNGRISGKMAKDIFAEMVETGLTCETIVRQKGLVQVSDPGALGSLVDQAIAGNPKAVADFKAGKTAAAKALVGQVMKASGGKANPAMVDRLVQEKLSRS